MPPRPHGPRLRPTDDSPRRRGLPIAALVFIACFLAVIAGTVWMLRRVGEPEPPAPSTAQPRPG